MRRTEMIHLSTRWFKIYQKLFATIKSLRIFTVLSQKMEILIWYTPNLGEERKPRKDDPVFPVSDFWSDADIVYIIFISSKRKNHRRSIEFRLKKYSPYEERMLFGSKFSYSNEDKNQYKKVVEKSSNKAVVNLKKDLAQ